MTVPYITNLEGDAYAADILNVDAWTDATEDDKTKGAKMATVAIDRLNFLGEKSVETQDNQFPRYDDTAYPDDIQRATFELALVLLDGLDPELEYDNLNMVSQGYSNIKSNYDRTVKPEHIVAGIPSITAWRLLRPYLRDPFTVDMRRGS